MPNKNDIINAISNIDIFLKVDELKGAMVKKNNSGKLFFFTGGFNMVFQLDKQSKIWAFRVWHINLHNIKNRFQTISNYLTKQKLPYFADFIYDEKGLLVNGELVDTIRMEWLDGLLLKEYIEHNLNNKKKLHKIADSFLSMCTDLHKHSISHGDLQHGNIIIDKNDNIRLIDYDSICVPDIEQQEELVTGLTGYQHPSRLKSKNKTSSKADYFSELIIYLSILAISEKPSLWETYQLKESDTLLFNEEDFINLSKSRIYKELSKGFSSEIIQLLDILSQYLSKSSYLDLKPFDQLLFEKNISFKLSKTKIRKGKESATLSWSIKKAHKVVLLENNVKVKECQLTDKITIEPKSTTTYQLKITAPDKNTQITRNLTLSVLEESSVVFTSDKEFVFPKIPIILSWEVHYAKKVELIGYGIVNENDTIQILEGIDNEKTFTLKVTDNFGTKNYNLVVKMLPIPLIKSLIVPIPKIQQEVKIQADLSLVCGINIPQIKTLDISFEAPFQLSINEMNLTIKEPDFREPNLKIQNEFPTLMKIENIIRQIITKVKRK